MASKQSWYVTERAEALAALYLTRRKDLEVIPVGRYETDYPLDLLVTVKSGDKLGDASFGIEVKGVRKEGRGAKGQFRTSYSLREVHDRGLPICTFLFAVDDEQGYYRWLLEPVVSPDGNAHLKLNLDIPADAKWQQNEFALRSQFAPLSDESIGALIEQVLRWYHLKDSHRRFIAD